MADPIRDAAIRLLQQLELRRTDPDAPLMMERAESDLRAALAAQPPADTPLDLDALLSPKGAYEPGIGHEDGAQLLTDRHGGNPQWWAPVYGCDTLDNLLDQIRSRILPHLRQPIAGIDVPAPDGDYGGLQELCDAEGVDVRIGAPLLKRAREAWKVAAQPPAPTPEIPEKVRLAFAELERKEQNLRDFRSLRKSLAVDQPPAAEPASDGEREELAQWIDLIMTPSFAEYPGGVISRRLARAATLLRRPAPAQAAVPVPVDERPWERDGWCDAQGRCWMGDPGGAGFIPSWRPCRPEDAPSMNVSLPHWAIPIPQPSQGGEVADA